MYNSGLSTMFEGFRTVKAEEGFGNLVSVAIEAGDVRDSMMDHLDDQLVDDSVYMDDDDIKSHALDNDDMEQLIENIPETEIDDASIAAGKITNQNVPVDEDEYVGAPLDEAMSMIEELIPDTEELQKKNNFLFK